MSLLLKFERKIGRIERYWGWLRHCVIVKGAIITSTHIANPWQEKIDAIYCVGTIICAQPDYPCYEETHLIIMHGNSDLKISI